jgi:magnesium-transporting ATPase (P-type)
MAILLSPPNEVVSLIGEVAKAADWSQRHPAASGLAISPSFEEIFMSTSTTAMPQSTSVFTTRAFWERFWRTGGIQFLVCFIIAYVIYGSQPQVGASADTLVAFYNGGRTRILIAAVFSGLAVLNLMWFAAALRTTLADAGQDGWGAAATASSAALGALFILLITVGAALAYSIAGSGNPALTSGLNDFAWAGVVLSSFPRAMLIMSGAFGLWRAALISNGLFAAGVAAVVLVLLGGTTWVSGGFWAPDGAYSRFVSPVICLAWVVVVSRVLLTQSPARAGW